MNCRTLVAASLVAMVIGAGAGSAQADTFDLTLTGNVGDFIEGVGHDGSLVFDQFYLPLSGIFAPITVVQGDSINSTVTLDSAYTIAASEVRTDLLQYFNGTFAGADTGVIGTFNFYLGSSLVQTLGYSSSTSGQLASFGILFPPDNVPFTFDSFTNSLLIMTLTGSAMVESSAFNYSLVSNGVPMPAAVPEPSAWALMIIGFGLVGGTLRQGRRRAPAITART